MIHKKAKNHPLFIGLKQFLSYARGRALILTALVIVQRASAGIGILLILPMMDFLGYQVTGAPHITNNVFTVFVNAGLPLTLESLLMFFLFIIGVVCVVQYNFVTYSTKIQQEYAHFLRSNIFQLIMQSSWIFISSRKTSELQHAISVLVQSVGYAVNIVISLFASLVALFVAVTVSFILSWQMTLLVIITAFIAIVILWPLFKKSKISGNRQLNSHRAIFHTTEAQLTNLKMIKCHGVEHRFSKLLEQESKMLESQIVTMAHITARTKMIFTIFGAVAASALFWLSQNWLNMPIPVVIALVIIYSRTLPLVSSIQNSLQQLLQRTSSFAALHQLVNECKSAQELPRTNSPIPFDKQIKIKNMSFAYADSPLLTNFSCTINKGDVILIQGTSGVGKSTIVDLIAGLIVPCKGQIFIDDIPLTRKNCYQWKQKVAYVTQDHYFFNDSLRNNLRALALDECNDEDIWQALELAAAKSFVEKLPHQLDTMIGDRGFKLSGGERQRIALARAVLRRPALLILDEATSALDYENELHIHRAITELKKNMTIVIISHNSNHAFAVDTVITLS